MSAWVAQLAQVKPQGEKPVAEDVDYPCYYGSREASGGWHGHLMAIYGGKHVQAAASSLLTSHYALLCSGSIVLYYVSSCSFVFYPVHSKQA